MEGSHVVAATDGSEISFRATEWAAREAALHGKSLRVISVPAMPPRMSWQRDQDGRPDTVADVIRESSEQALSTARARAAAQVPELPMTADLLSGSPDHALVQAASGAAMLVTGSRGRGGFASLVLGSVSRYVAAHAPCPVVVVREEAMPVHELVVVGVSDPSQPTALSFAFEEARLRKAAVHAVLAWELFLPTMRLMGTERPGAAASEVTAEAAGWLAELLAPWRHDYPGVRLTHEVVHAHPGRVLAGASARADLVVLGRGGATAAPGGGAVTHAVLHHSECPVAIVPA